MRPSASSLKTLWASATSVQLGVDESGRIIGRELLQEDRVSHAALEIFVAGERKTIQELGLGNEDEVVVFGEILEEQAQTAESRDIHQVRVVDDVERDFSRGD